MTHSSKNYKKWATVAGLGLALFAGSTLASAQDNAEGGNRRDRRAERGSDGESGGGRDREGGGGNRGGGGGWGGGNRGGGWGGPGGGGGGPGGGGFGGGGPWGGGGGPWGGGGGGGPWGGGPGGPGGGWGGRGRGGGGFDPSAMISRFDTNGNKQIDLDEMQGPARFMLERMARDNPKIDLTKPIPLSVLGAGNDPESEGSEDSKDEPLVPDFKGYKANTPPSGFGKSGELFSVKITEVDQREASERLNRYDRNKDGALDEAELRNGRWQDNPMQYDRNQDGKLQVSELAVRFAKNRINSESNSESDKSENENQGRRGGWGGWGGGPEGDAPADGAKKDEEQVPAPWQNRASFRLDAKVTAASKVQGAPGWFTAADVNNDGQVDMKEFASDWSETEVQDFRNFDVNDDGIISGKECLAAVKKGVIRGAGGSAKTSSTSSASSSTTTNSSLSENSFELPPEAESWRPFIYGQLKRNDPDKNGKFTIDEWRASNGDFSAVDADGDGVVTPAEFGLYKVNKK